MKRLSFLVIIALLLGFAAPVALQASASAVDIFNNCSGDASGSCTDCSSGASTTDVCTELKGQIAGTNPVIHIIRLVINLVSFVGGAAAVIGLLVGGLRLALARGDTNTIGTARNAVLYSLIGIVAIVAAQTIVVFVLNKLN